METIPKQTNEIDPFVSQDAVAQEAHRSREIQPVLVDSLKVTTHGIAAWVSEKRMKRAGTVMEKMDHKNALYEDMSSLARSISKPPAETVSGQPAKPRTFAERFMDKRAEKKSWKLALKRAQKNWEIEMFGGTGNTRTMSYASKGKDYERRSKINQQYKSGKISAFERRIELDSISAKPSRTENPRSKQLRRIENRAQKSLDRSADQPILSWWRSKRRERAISVIKSSHISSEKHKVSLEQKKQELSDKKANNRRIRTINTLRKLTPERAKRQNISQPKIDLEYKEVTGTDGISRRIPVRPNSSKTRKYKRPARTERGRKYQEQQELNANGLV